MIHFKVRHLATSFGGSRAAAAAFERTVSIWDLQTGEHVATFQTVLDFGGRRIVVNEQGTLCAAAAYSGRGLACYDISTGSVIWSRRDLKHLQDLSVSRDATQLYCGAETRGCAVLDFATGQTLDSFRGVRRVVEDRYQSILFLDQAQPLMRHLHTGALLPIIPTRSSFMDATFGPDLICVSECAGPIRALDKQTASEVWRCEQPPGRHALRVQYVESEQAFAAIDYSFTVTGCPRELVLLDATTGVRRGATDLGSIAEAEFCDEGRAVLTSDGRLIATSSGLVVRTLPFS